jgi:hypothetical protein
MPLQPGDKLGLCEILAPLGTGGMGENRFNWSELSNRFSWESDGWSACGMDVFSKRWCVA